VINTRVNPLDMPLQENTNSSTIQDAYPLPRIDESLDALMGSKYFSTLDLLSGYWQVPLSPDAQDKAAFITRD